MPEVWSVDTRVLRNTKTGENETCYVVARGPYYFNYAYEEYEKAMEIMRELMKDKATDRATDLAFNYVRASRVTGVAKRTSQKRNWYLMRETA